MSRKIAEREVRQQFIIDAAQRLYSEKGIENTTMEDIAEASEYTRRTLYSYFTDRDEICFMALIQDMEFRWAEQKTAIESPETGIKKLRAWANCLYSYVKRNPHSIRLQLFWDYKGIESSKVNTMIFSRFEDINNELADGLQNIFQLGAKDGSIRTDCNNNTTISQFLGSFRGVLNRAIIPTYSFAKVKSDSYIEHFLTIFCRGIGSSGDSPSC